MKNRLCHVLMMALILCSLVAAVGSAYAGETADGSSIQLDNDKGQLKLFVEGDDTFYQFSTSGRQAYSGALTLSQEGNTIYTKGVVIQSGNHNIILDGVYIAPAEGTADISPIALHPGAALTLTLANGSTNKLYAQSGNDNQPGTAGIYVPSGAQLIIQGVPDATDAVGKLLVQGGNGAAGIGGSSIANQNANAGDITINGGDVQATGGLDGAGIGGGKGGVGIVTVEGASKVTAIGNDKSAGIGGGKGSSGYVTINGAAGMEIVAKGVCALGGINERNEVDGNIVLNQIKLWDCSLTPEEELSAYGLQPHVRLKYKADLFTSIALKRIGILGDSYIGFASGTSAIASESAPTVVALDSRKSEVLFQQLKLQFFAGERSISIIAGTDASATDGTTLDTVGFVVNRQSILAAGGPFQNMFIFHENEGTGKIDKLSTTETINGERITYIGDASGLDGSPFVLVGVKGEPAPQTGDAATPWLWVGLLVLAGAGFAACAVRSRKKRRV